VLHARCLLSRRRRRRRRIESRDACRSPAILARADVLQHSRLQGGTNPQTHVGEAQPIVLVQITRGARYGRPTTLLPFLVSVFVGLCTQPLREIMSGTTVVVRNERSGGLNRRLIPPLHEFLLHFLGVLPSRSTMPLPTCSRGVESSLVSFYTCTSASCAGGCSRRLIKFFWIPPGFQSRICTL